MLDKMTQDAIGREMRRRHEDKPKGAIPNRLWRLLLAIEAASPAPGNSTLSSPHAQR